jgi:hypothetical protein
MGAIHTPTPVKLFVGIISGYTPLFDTAESLLVKEFGPVDLKTDIIPFDFTDYYTKEMGANLKRRFLSFERLIMPDEISRIKICTNQLEADLANSNLNLKSEIRNQKFEVPRPINLDPGYLDRSKLVLATTKDYNHRIYLRDGIYAEVTLQYRTKGGFQPFPWTYPDYQTKPYLDFFNQIRNLYLNQANT